MEKKLSIRLGSYFPTGFLVAAVLSGVAGLALLIEMPVAGVLLLLGSIVVLTTHYRLEIDPAKKEYFEFVWIAGIKHGKPERFEKIDYLFIKPKRVTQTLGLRVASSTIHKEQFDGYLRFSEDDKVHLLTSEKKAYVLKRLHALAKSLNTRVIDYSESVKP